jgi:hypothetical protein
VGQISVKIPGHFSAEINSQKQQVVAKHCCEQSVNEWVRFLQAYGSQWVIQPKLIIL